MTPTLAAQCLAAHFISSASRHRSIILCSASEEHQLLDEDSIWNRNYLTQQPSARDAYRTTVKIWNSQAPLKSDSDPLLDDFYEIFPAFFDGLSGGHNPSQALHCGHASAFSSGSYLARRKAAPMYSENILSSTTRWDLMVVFGGERLGQAYSTTLTGSAETMMSIPPKGGIDRHILSLKSTQPSITDISSCGTLLWSCQMPIRRADLEQWQRQGSSSSMILYCARSKAAWMYSANMGSILDLLRF